MTVFRWFVLTLFVFGCFCASADEGNRPNLVLIVTDDQGYADVGFNGCLDIPTPHIDRIAAEGVRFTNGYVSYSICSPSRAGFITGRYQGRFGYRNNPTENPDDAMAGLPLSEENMAEILHKVDYHTGVIGKWHLGTHPRFRPNRRGFDEFYGFLAGGHRYFPEELTIPNIEAVARKNGWFQTKLRRNDVAVETDEYLTDEFSNEAVDFITRHHDKSFLLYVAYNAPHGPMQASEKYLLRFDHIEDPVRKTYAAMVSAVDDGVGRILSELDRLGIAEDTLVFFISDNGGAVNNGASNAPLRGGKGNIHEGGMRVPFAFRWTGTAPEGVDYEEAVSSLDILGTIAGITGVPIAEDRPLDGVDLMPYLTGRKTGAPHEYLFWEMFRKQDRAVRAGNDKLLVFGRTDGEVDRLYDLAEDQGESNNLTRVNPAKVRRLKAELDQWTSELMPPQFDAAWDPRNNPARPRVEYVDSTPPMLTSFTLSPTVIDLINGAQSVAFTATATDDDSGVDRILIRIDRLGGSFRNIDLRLQDDQWTGTLPLNENQPVGDWSINGIVVCDAAGNLVRVTAADLAREGYPNSFSVVRSFAPAITTQPVAVTVTAGAVANFSVTASGTEPLTYQWKKDGTDLSGATAATYEIASVDSADAGDYTVVVSNSAGDVTSNAATLTVNAAVVAPGITSQPTSRTVDEGDAVSFSVGVSGTTPLTYQWRRNGSAIAGATAATYEIASVDSADAGDYTVVVSNSAGNVTSNAATLAVTAAVVAPGITSQPTSRTVDEGDAVSFSVGVSGTTPLTYQWRRNGSAIAGATAATYEIASVDSADAGDYTVVVSNSAGDVTSSAATLTVNAAVVAPTITSQPTSRTVDEGDAVSFSVGVSGTTPLTYQWRRNGNAIAGATAATYRIVRTQQADAGAYSVVVSNSAGNVTSNAATLTVNAVAPTITSQPAARDVVVGDVASFSVTATGTAPLTYRWRRNGADLPGATNATYRITRAALADAGDYTVVVTNSAGNVASSAATLTVTEAVEAPAITTQPTDITVDVGAAATFSVVATGTAPLTYQWRKDGNDIPGATAVTYRIASAELNDAGDYSVTVTNSEGNVISSAATLTVNAVAPMITTQPATVDVVVGDAANFSVVATGTAPLTYQWRQDGNAIPGAITATYAITSAVLTHSGNYTVVVSNAAGNVTSASATLTVTAAVVAPDVTTHPTSRTVDEGDTVSFGVGATGTAPLTYQWRRNGSDIPGSNSPIHFIASAGQAHAGNYTVVVTNAAGSVTSSAATLMVTAAIIAPAITSPPATKAVVVGGGASFSVTATGTAPLTYQWRKNGANIAGATATTYAIASATQADAGTYSVVVTNAAGSVISPVATLSVSDVAIAPAITAQPMAQSVGVGAAANFSVSVSGTAPFTWQWRKDGSDIPNATAATYAIASTQLTDAGAYSVVVTNSAGSVTSSAATLTVTESSVLSNISVRIPLAESQVLVMGAVVAGGSRNLLIRAAGPALEAITMGQLEGLPDPQITLYDPAGGEIGENDDWDNALADTFASVGAFVFPANSRDSAYLLEEASGAFTVHASGKDGAGFVLVEAYDLSTASSARLTNVSARNVAGTGDDIFIAGFAIAGTASSRVLVRAIGPTLGEPPYLVPEFLEDPVLTVFNREMEAILSNDDWDPELAETFESVGAFPLADASKDAALIVDLEPGSYTVQVVGADDGGGGARP